MENLPTVRVPASPTPLWSDSGMMTDSFANFVSRLGVSGKSPGATYIHTFFNRIEAEAAYRGTWFGTICDIPPFDEVRAGRTWAGADEDQITAITKEETRLGLFQKIKEARTLARKDGGSALFIGAGGDAATPLTPEMIQKDGVKYLSVIMRDEISPAEEDRDATSPNFRQPVYYTLSNSVATRIHPSRIIRFVGRPIRQLGFWDGWGDSIWMELRSAILQTDQIAAAVAELVEEAKVDVMRIKNLANNLVNAESEAMLTRRFSLVNTLKSTVNALLLDMDDEYDQKTQTFTGVKDIQEMALMILSGKSGIPATRLLGRSPQGMNATGESDMRNYWDRIKATQTVEIGPLISTLDEMLIRSALGDRPEEIYYEWNPLYQMSEKEAAEVEKIYGETAAGYANAALIPDTALASIVKQGIIERGQWPGAEKAFAEAEAEGDEPGITAEPTEAELAAEAAQIATSEAVAADPAGMASNRPRLAANDATPRTLYVRRDVVNKADIVKWAKAQGFTDIVPDLHVTIVHSRKPVDWFKVGTSWAEKVEIAKGGPRQLEKLGKNGEYVVLLITASELVWRNREIIEAGASTDWPEYQPHISLQVGGDVNISAMEPYRGKIVLGPEIFEEVEL